MKKKGVVWVSTVLYVLIGLAIIGSLLAIVRPKIAETKDRFIIEQTVQSLNNLDDLIIRTREATGTKLSFKITLDKGNFVIDGQNEKIYWTGESNYKYSEIDKTINIGRIKALTTKKGSIWEVTLTEEYAADDLDFMINGNSSNTKIITPAGLPYMIWIFNNGTKIGKQQIDFLIE